MAKKLYFDFQFTNSNQARIFPCTWPTTASGNTTATVIERHRALMDALPAVTGGASSAVKQAREVGAWFNLTQVFTTDYFNRGYAPLLLDFVGRNLTTRIPFLDPGNVVVTTKAGHTPIFTSHFAVRLRLFVLPDAGVANDIRGVCYVQRQHSVEV